MSFDTGSNGASRRRVSPRHGRRRAEIYRRRARGAKRRRIRQLMRARRAFHQELWIPPRVAPSYASTAFDTTNLEVQLTQVRSRRGGDVECLVSRVISMGRRNTKLGPGWRLKQKLKPIARVRPAGTLSWLGFDRVQSNTRLSCASVVERMHWMVLHRPVELARVSGD